MATQDMSIAEALEALAEHRSSEVVVATMTAGFLWPRYSKSELDFAYLAPMGSAAALGLGLAIGRPDQRVIVLDGDGSLLMNLGVLVTIGNLQPPNLVHIVLENREYSITGGQKVPSANRAELASIARAAGIANASRIADLGEWKTFLGRQVHEAGPIFVDLRVSPGYDRDAVPELTHAPGSRKRQGKEGFHRLRALILA